MRWYKKNLEYIVNQIYNEGANKDLIKDFLVAYEAESGDKSLRNIDNSKLFLGGILFILNPIGMIGSSSGITSIRNEKNYKHIRNSTSSNYHTYKKNHSTSNRFVRSFSKSQIRNINYSSSRHHEMV